MATFKVLNEETRSLDHHDFLFARYPEFQAILLALATGEKASIAFASAEPLLARELENKGIALLSLDDKNESIVIGLKPNAIASITLFARYHNEPSTRRELVIESYKSASIWLMQSMCTPEASISELSQDDINILTLQGALIESDPPAIAAYPDPFTTAELCSQQLATAEQVFVQNSGDAIPEKVIRLLGKQIPELPNSTIVWTCDAGTRLPNATLLSDKSISELITEPKQRLAIPSVVAQKKQWQQKLSIAKIEFKRQAYAQLVDIISPAHQLSLKAHVKALVNSNYFGPIGDGQVDRRMAIHNETVTASLHHRLAKLVSLITGEKLQASYAYLGCYLGGAVLERHVDRAQCQYNLSIVFDMSDEEDNAAEPWPIYLQVKNKPVAVNLDVGSGLLYRGTEIEHWREKLPEGHRAIVCFYHFVGASFDGALI
jgi:hypothetical protein